MMTFKVDNLNDLSGLLGQFVEYLLKCGLTEDDAFSGRLVGCELLSNVIRHCGREAVFKGGIEGDMIVISVSSDSTKTFRLCRELPDVLAESGRGLYIVNAVCHGNIAFKDNAVVAKIKIGDALI